MNVPLDKILQYELQACHKNCPNTIIIQPSLKTLSQWQVYIHLTSGVFKSCTITFVLFMERIPKEAPYVVFQSNVFHPLIEQGSSKFEVSTICPEWNNESRIYNLLNSIYDSFISIPVVQSGYNPNPEASKLYQQDLKLYSKKALEMLQKPESPNDQTELNSPKRWNQVRENAILKQFGEL